MQTGRRHRFKDHWTLSGGCEQVIWSRVQVDILNHPIINESSFIIGQKYFPFIELSRKYFGGAANQGLLGKLAIQAARPAPRGTDAHEKVLFGKASDISFSIED